MPQRTVILTPQRQSGVFAYLPESDDAFTECAPRWFPVANRASRFGEAACSF
jgi:hypothetical protein